MADVFAQTRHLEDRELCQLLGVTRVGERRDDEEDLELVGACRALLVQDSKYGGCNDPKVQE